MRHDILRSFLIATSALAFAVSGAASAQTTYPQAMPATGFSDADQLAQQMRTLAANPRNLDALIRAGQLALRLDDATAASGFFARAERIDPRNARIKAGQASVLVAQERPGEALRKFAEAETLGIDPHVIAADRGLAYDLIGEQRRAQIDYKTAVQFDPSDETTRRYALSLGISGKKDEAEKLLDPLLRRNDRGAWRARAFVLAMTGDQRGAEQIAATMMPPGMAQGLQIFFDRLPGFSPVDRAFAVHFGEVRASPARLADARLVPILPALAPEPAAPPVQVAAVQTAPARTGDRRDRKRKGRETALAAAVTAPVTPTPAPLPPPPSYLASVAAPMVQPLPGVATARSAAPLTAMVQPLPNSGRNAAVRTATVQPLPATVTPRPAASSAMMQPLPQRTMTAMPVRSVAAATPTANPVLSSTPIVLTARTTAPPAVSFAQAPSLTPAQVAVVTPAPANAPPKLASATATVPTPGFSAAASPAASAAAVPSSSSSLSSSSAPSLASLVGSGAASSPAVPARVTQTPAGTAVASETRVAVAVAPPAVPATSESSIVSTLSSGGTLPATTAVAPTSAPVAMMVTPSAASTPPSQARPAPVLPKVEPEPAPRPAPARESLKTLLAASVAAQNTSDRGAGRNAATVTKAGIDAPDDKSAARKADARKLADKKAAEEKKRNDPKRLEPERIWVQVAGGANEETLSKAYGAVQGKAGALKGRGAYTTPLRATNRVLVGPFKTEAEAQALVNKLGGQGVSAFTFTSEAGQKVSKLPGK